MISTTKRTPKFSLGEWMVNEKAKLNVICNKRTMANCSSSQNGDFLEEEQSNALLISKAPEMYFLCEEMASFIRERMLIADPKAFELYHKIIDCLNEIDEIPSQIMEVEFEPLKSEEDGKA